jgi:hypothetical protein
MDQAFLDAIMNKSKNNKSYNILENIYNKNSKIDILFLLNINKIFFKYAY